MKKATSAGGVVVRLKDGRPEILLIRDLKYDDWFLPKGHAEDGETLEQTALREIDEETHLNDLEIICHLGNFVRYAEAADEMKTHHYFLLKHGGKNEAVPEDDKNWEVNWFSLDKLPKFYLKEQESIVRDNLDKISKAVED